MPVSVHARFYSMAWQNIEWLRCGVLEQCDAVQIDEVLLFTIKRLFL